MTETNIIIIEQDSSIRAVLTKMTERLSGFKVILSTADGQLGLENIQNDNLHLIMLSTRIQGMSCTDFLQKMTEIENCVPVLMVAPYSNSGMTQVIEALRLGAVDFIPEPKDTIADDIENIFRELKIKLEILSRNYKLLLLQISGKQSLSNEPKIKKKSMRSLVDKTKLSKTGKIAEMSSDVKIIAMGLSIGGPKLLVEILPSFKKRFAIPFLIVQQLNKNIVKLFVKNLAKSCDYNVLEAVHHTEILPSTIYLAPGNKQMGVIKCDKKYLIETTYTDKISEQVPSIDYLFRSLADVYGEHTIALLMTGYGKDGVSGMRLLKSKGAVTLAQESQSCAVPEKSQIAVEQKIVDEIVPGNLLPKRLKELVRLSRSK